MHDDASRSSTTLTRRTHGTKQDRSQRQIEVGIIGDDDAVITPQLQDGAPQAAGDRFCYVAPHADRPGEADEGQARIVDHPLADVPPGADDEIKHPVQAVISGYLVCDVLDGNCRQWCTG